MKYYIDFEFNTSNEIISIGIIDNSGRTFHSLVKARNSISTFIERLTGITNKDMQKAPTIYNVCEWLKNWLKELNADDIFYVYGDQDIPILKSTINRVRLTTDAEKVFKHIITHSIDFSEDVLRHFNLIKKVKLIDVVNYYSGNDMNQNHNALDDAILLKECVDKVSVDVNDISEAFPQYKTNVSNYYDTVIIEQLNDNKDLVTTFENLSIATQWTVNNIIKPSQRNYRSSKIRNRIKECLKEPNIKYCGYYWRIKTNE